jgi:phage shock protein A
MARDGILKKLSYWFRGKQNEVEDAMTNPELEGAIDLEDAEKELAKFESQVRDLVATNMGVIRERDAAKADFEKLDKAVKVIKTKRDAITTTVKSDAGQDIEGADTSNPEYMALDADLKTAAGLAVSAKQKMESLTTTIDMNDKTITQLKSQITDVQGTISSSKNKFDQLKARNTSAKIRKDIAESQDGLMNGDSAIAKLGKFEKAVENMEDTANAQEDMNASTNSGKAENIVEKYTGTSKEAAVDDYLNQL